MLRHVPRFCASREKNSWSSYRVVSLLLSQSLALPSLNPRPPSPFALAGLFTQSRMCSWALINIPPFVRVMGYHRARWEPCKFSVPTLSMVTLCTNQTACMAFLSSMHLLFLKLCPLIKLRFPAFLYSLCEDRQLSASYSSLGGRLVNRWKKKPRGETLFKGGHKKVWILILPSVFVWLKTS